MGPGSYDPKMQKDGVRDTISERVGYNSELGWNASFVSDSFRTLMTNIFPTKGAGSRGEVTL